MLAMLLAVIGTLMHHDLVRFDWIIAGLAVGSIVGVVIGLPLGVDIPMTAMPQFVAISHLFGAVAATLVGVDEYFAMATRPSTFVMTALGFEVILGALTVTGSFMAFAKLQELIGGNRSPTRDRTMGTSRCSSSRSVCSFINYSFPASRFCSSSCSPPPR